MGSTWTCWLGSGWYLFLIKKEYILVGILTRLKYCSRTSVRDLFIIYMKACKSQLAEAMLQRRARDWQLHTKNNLMLLLVKGGSKGDFRLHSYYRCQTAVVFRLHNSAVFAPLGWLAFGGLDLKTLLSKSCFVNKRHVRSDTGDFIKPQDFLVWKSTSRGTNS